MSVCRGNEGGFALLVMFGVIASASLGIVLATQALVPPTANAQLRTDGNVGHVELVAREAYRRNGVFPSDLGTLATTAGGMTGPRWRLDPYGAAQDLDYGLVGRSLRVRSRGPDGQLGTADDTTAVISPETLVRGRQRARLRIIRAVLARSPYRLAGSMSSGDEATMLTALRDFATARRQWLTATAAERTDLQTQMDDAATTIQNLATTHGCTPLPAAVTGAGGLMNGLGMPDSKAVDGAGATLLLDTAVGVVARGSDGVGGNNDDM